MIIDNQDMTVGKYTNQHLPTEEQKSFSKSCRKKNYFLYLEEDRNEQFCLFRNFLRNHHIMHEEGR